MEVTAEQVEEMFGSGREEWVDPINKTLAKFDISTPERVSMFLAQVAHESRNLTEIHENLNYRAEQLRRVFPKYFNAARAQQYAHDPEAIANRVYANRYGNGDEDSGDGWKYRGRGAIQLTFHDNYEAFAEAVGMTIDQVGPYLETPEGAMMSAGWYWSTRHLNAPADRGDVRTCTKLINGGYIGLAEREEAYGKATDIFTA